MTGAGRWRLLTVAALLVVACGRSATRQEPAPVAGPRAGPPPDTTPPPDTVAERIAREREKARLDSIVHALYPKMVLDSGPRRDSAVAAVPAAEVPPSDRCIMDFTNRDGTGAILHRDPATGKYYSFIGGGIHGKCRNQDITITGDSAESYEAQNLYILIGNVHYREPRMSVDAQRMTYYRAEERLVAEQQVHAVMLPDSATLDGPRVEYFRAVRGVRDKPRVIATERPHLTYIERDSLGRPQPPVLLNAARIVSDGDSTFHAVGAVEMRRGEVVATGDSGFVDAAHNFARLVRNPRIESRGADPYTLRGKVIDMYGAGRRVDRVIAVDSASAVSREFTVSADTIDLRVKENRLDHAYAFGPTGATVHTPERDVVADSLDIIMPAQHIRELRAVGKAYAESDPDTLQVISQQRDWLRGDTVVALFDSVAAGDTTSRTRIRELQATGDASAFYQMRADRQPKDNPGLNYVIGRVIRLEFARSDSTQGSEVRTVTVVDKARGVYLTPDTTRVTRKPAARPPARRPPR